MTKKIMAKDLKVGNWVRGFNKTAQMLDSVSEVTGVYPVGMSSIGVDMITPDGITKRNVYGKTSVIYINE